MPEGHTVHRLARELRATLGGAPVVASSPQGRFEAGARLLDGGVITRSDAWGKYLFVAFGDRVLHVHLGLIGKFRDKGSAPPLATDTVRLRLASDTATWDLTGPSRCEVITRADQRVICAGLGADPLRRGADIARMRARIGRSAKPIGAVLLDQTVIAGLGNIYRAEILFLCGVDPRRESRRLDDHEVDGMWRHAVRLLRIGLRHGRIITTDPAEIGRSRPRMRAQDTLYVYHRDHCRRCGTEIRTVELGGRPMQWCPGCQPA